MAGLGLNQYNCLDPVTAAPHLVLIVLVQGTMSTSGEMKKTISRKLFFVLEDSMP